MHTVGDTDIVEEALTENPPVRISDAHADLLRNLAPNKSQKDIVIRANNPWPNWVPSYLGVTDSVATQLLKDLAIYVSECVVVEGPDANGIATVSVNETNLSSEVLEDGRAVLRCRS